MTPLDALARQFDSNRGLLLDVAYRMLGSRTEAEDAVQEAWLRLERNEGESIDNLPGWLRTVVARICLDQLRARKARREESMPVELFGPIAAPDDTERDAMLADSVGLAMLVVLQNLTPAERVAFVLHDMFDLSFDEVGRVLGRTPVATRQLASRARRRVRGAPAVPASDLAEQRLVVDAYLTAAREGSLDGLLAVLDPDIVVRKPGAKEIRGAELVAKGALAVRARFARPILVNGRVGLVVAPYGRLRMVLALTIRAGRIVAVDTISDPAAIEGVELTLLDE
jgi:RNA polymerase sigma-70 factor (ECF subfamily)